MDVCSATYLLLLLQPGNTFRSLPDPNLNAQTIPLQDAKVVSNIVLSTVMCLLGSCWQPAPPPWCSRPLSELLCLVLPCPQAEYNPYGYDKYGYDKYGYDKYGYGKDGYHKDGYGAAG